MWALINFGCACATFNNYLPFMQQVVEQSWYDCIIPNIILFSTFLDKLGQLIICTYLGMCGSR